MDEQSIVGVALTLIVVLTGYAVNLRNQLALAETDKRDSDKKFTSEQSAHNVTKGQLIEAQATINVKNDQLQKATIELEVKAKQLSQATDTINDIYSKLGVMQSQFDSEIADLKTQLQDVIRQKQAVEDMRDGLQAQLIELQKSNRILAQQRDGLQFDKDLLKAENEQLHKDLITVRQQLQDSQNAIADNAKLIKTLKTQIDNQNSLQNENSTDKDSE